MHANSGDMRNIIKRTKVEAYMHKFLGYLFFMQLALAAAFSFLQVEFEHDRG